MAENAPTGDENSSPKTPLDFLKEARADQMKNVIGAQCALIEARSKFHEIGGDEDIEAGLLRIIEANPDGLSLVSVRGVHEDQKALNKARTALEKAGKIHEATKGQATVIKLGPAPAVAK